MLALNGCVYACAPCSCITPNCVKWILCDDKNVLIKGWPKGLSCENISCCFSIFQEVHLSFHLTKFAHVHIPCTALCNVLPKARLKWTMANRFSVEIRLSKRYNFKLLRTENEPNNIGACWTRMEPAFSSVRYTLHTTVNAKLRYATAFSSGKVYVLCRGFHCCGFIYQTFLLIFKWRLRFSYSIDKRHCVYLCKFCKQNTSWPSLVLVGVVFEKRHRRMEKYST